MCFEAFCLLVAQLGQVALTETIHLLAKYIAMDKSHVVEYLSCIFGKKSNSKRNSFSNHPFSKHLSKN